MWVFWPIDAVLITRNVIIAFGFLIVSSTTTTATVYEYDSEGSVSVSQAEKTPKSKQTNSRTSSSSKLKSLTRDIALQFSGAVGVRKAGLDALTFVEVFEKLIERESAFNPFAVSGKGAKGLGQLMPDTANDMGVSDPFDARSNLTGSAKYFTSMLRQFGSLELALAAYNAGPERVRQYKGVPPFAETKAYIAWIFEKSGVETKSVDIIKATPASAPINKDKPLKGDVSVWEF